MLKIPAVAVATLSLACSIALVASPATASTGRIAITPDPITLTPGVPATLTLDLDEVMICIEADPCQLVLDLSVGLPDGFTISPSVVTIDATAWAQVVELTATLDEDSPLNTDDEFTVSATAVSGSEYYNGFQTSVAFIVGPEAPAVDDELAATGVTNHVAAAFAVGLTSMAAAIALVTRKRRLR